MDTIKKTIITFCKAQFSAWIASAIDFLVTIITAHFIGFWYGYSTFVGALAGGIVNCAINYRWVFRPNGIKKRRVVTRYIIVWTGSIMLNTLGTLVLTELTGFSFIIVKAIIAVIVAVVWNYQMQRLFVFKKRSASKSS